MIELFTVTEVRQNERGTVLLPGFCLTDKRPEVQKLIQGCLLVLLHPDGRMKFTELLTYGMPVEVVDGHIQLPFNPALEPEKVFLQITVEKQDVPIGTRILLQ